ncbi:hypothetical protein SUGI_0049540 [Cryptomeria japonica]|nr:hypothetical protein SUGI_0049540 [Cryptomeria japonica]
MYGCGAVWLIENWLWFLALSRRLCNVVLLGTDKLLSSPKVKLSIEELGKAIKRRRKRGICIVQVPLKVRSWRSRINLQPTFTGQKKIKSW